MPRIDKECSLLLVEDNPGDANLVRLALVEAEVRSGTTYSMVHVECLTAATRALQGEDIDVVLMDLSFPDALGLESLANLSQWAPTVPIVVLSANNDEKVALKAVQAGAQDYLVKSELQSPILARALRYAIERKHTEQRLKLLGQTDGLTGLANRGAFLERFASIVTQSRRNDQMCAVMIIDLDRFKEMNDSLGHDVGDMFLATVAAKLLECTRETDVVARLGGDEFAVVATNLKVPDSAVKVAQSILDSLCSIEKVGSHSIQPGASIGLTIFPLDNVGPQSLLKHADIALYSAKKSNGSQFCFYDEEMDRLLRRNQDLTRELYPSIDRQHFVPHFQPILDTTTGRTIGAEVLARWQHPERGQVPPGDFIPLAEKCGLIDKLCQQILTQACRQQRAWSRDLALTIPIAVNISAVQCRRAGLADMVLQAIDAIGIEPEHLELEITENVLMHELDIAARELDRLHDHGVRISIDDFGTGYSSLSYLQRLPVDKLKIDRSFVCNLPENLGNLSIIRAIVGLVENLGLEVVAEGVETEAQMTCLRDIGCVRMQGYYFSPPLCAQDFVVWAGIASDMRVAI